MKPHSQAALLPLAVGFALGFSPAPAEDSNTWIGKTVVTKQKTPLQARGQVVDSGEIFRIYTVEQTYGDWLLVVSGSAAGWVKVDDVIPFGKAIDYFSQEIKSNSSASLYNMRGQMWEKKHEHDLAIADYNEAIRLDPKDPWQYNNRGNAWSEKQDYPRAIEDFASAVRLDSKNPWYLNNRAWLWATCPDARYRDGKKAVESATEAVRLTEWKEGQKLGTLAAACAEAGDFDSAVKWQTIALGLYPKDDGDLKKMGTKLLKLYQEKKPYRAPVPGA